MPVSPALGPVRLYAALFSLAIVLATLLAYVPAMRAGFIWDDDAHVDPGVLEQPDALYRIWFVPRTIPQYYPMTHTVLWVEYHLWGMNPAGYHLANILLHAANAVLLGLLLMRLGVPGGWWAALVFALHPVHVESVVWITEHKNTLSTLFYLLAALAYLRFHTQRQADAPARTSWWAYGLALGLFLMAMLSKTVTASLPAALLLALWWRTGRFAWRDAALLLPFLIIGAAMGLLTAAIEVHYVGAEGDEWNLSAAQRLLIAGRAVWFYLYKLALPLRLTFIYPRWNVDPGQLWQWLFPLAAGALLAALWLARRRIGRGPLAAALFFGGTLLPALGFFDVYPFRYSFVADHFQYLASIGPIALAAAGAHLLWQRLRWHAALLLPVPLVLAGLTAWQARSYRSEEALWNHVLRNNPGAWLGHSRLAAMERERLNFPAAMAHLDRSLEMHPRSAWAHNEYGRIFLQLEQYERAAALFRRAAEIKPDYAAAHHFLGFTLQRMGHWDEAAIEFEKAVSLNPQDHEALTNLGLMREKQGKIAEAIECYRAALIAAPAYPPADQRLQALGAAGR